MVMKHPSSASAVPDPGTAAPRPREDGGEQGGAAVNASVDLDGASGPSVLGLPGGRGPGGWSFSAPRHGWQARRPRRRHEPRGRSTYRSSADLLAAARILGAAEPKNQKTRRNGFRGPESCFTERLVR